MHEGGPIPKLVHMFCIDEMELLGITSNACNEGEEFICLRVIKAAILHELGKLEVDLRSKGKPRGVARRLVHSRIGLREIRIILVIRIDLWWEFGRRVTLDLDLVSEGWPGEDFIDGVPGG